MERLTHGGTKEAKNDVNIMQVLGKLAYYEDMEEQGRMKILSKEDKDSGTSENREWILYIDRLPPEPPKVAQTKEELEEMISNGTLQEYLVTLNSGGRVTTLYYAGDSYWYDQGKELLLVVIAWQPLPEPYKQNNQAAVEKNRKTKSKMNEDIEEYLTEKKDLYEKNITELEKQEHDLRELLEREPGREGAVEDLNTVIKLQDRYNDLIEFITELQESYF